MNISDMKIGCRYSLEFLDLEGEKWIPVEILVTGIDGKYVVGESLDRPGDTFVGDMGYQKGIRNIEVIE